MEPFMNHSLMNQQTGQSITAIKIWYLYWMPLFKKNFHKMSFRILKTYLLVLQIYFWPTISCRFLHRAARLGTVAIKKNPHPFTQVQDLNLLQAKYEKKKVKYLLWHQFGFHTVRLVNVRFPSFCYNVCAESTLVTG